MLWQRVMRIPEVVLAEVLAVVLLSPPTLDGTYLYRLPRGFKWNLSMLRSMSFPLVLRDHQGHVAWHWGRV